MAGRYEPHQQHSYGLHRRTESKMKFQNHQINSVLVGMGETKELKLLKVLKGQKGQ